MPKFKESGALHRLYTTRRPEGLPPFLDELYPAFMSVIHHLGDAGSCPNGGPGITYGNWDFECDGGTTLVRSVEWGEPQTPVRTALYRLHDQRGALLYVGIAENPDRRRKEHAGSKPWWPEVAAHSVTWYSTRDLALAAEADAIRTERPRYNVQHNKIVA
ncbi:MULTISPECIES: GIY-YIG nuclease family protein [unclassified Streptomyces]|uniref:GIY-YIG nuclease family protein n=1 Tax=unclassified Streptomyces TaxID=2593676 RepID=UPI0033B86B18